MSTNSDAQATFALLFLSISLRCFYETTPWLWAACLSAAYVSFSSLGRTKDCFNVLREEGHINFRDEAFEVEWQTYLRAKYGSPGRASTIAMSASIIAMIVSLYHYYLLSGVVGKFYFDLFYDIRFAIASISIYTSSFWVVRYFILRNLK